MNADIFVDKRVKIVFNEDANEDPRYQREYVESCLKRMKNIFI